MLNVDEIYNDILSSSDDEDAIDIERRPRVINKRINYFETLDDVDLLKRFRLSKNSVETLLLEIEPNLQHATQRNHAISPGIQLLLALRYYATGSHLISAGDFSGVSKTSAHRIVHRVTAAIASLSCQFIKVPTTPEERTAAQVDFYGIARFPRIISALDCTHVKVQSFKLAAASSDGGYSVMSSFRPSNSAKLYASPEDMKSVGYRSRSLPAHSTRSHVRKSHSFRTPNGSTSFNAPMSQQITNSSGNAVINTNSNGQQLENNQYAQPLKIGRNHSTTGNVRERKKKNGMTTSSSATNLSATINCGGASGPNTAPPIPEPDYSLSESENDEEEDLIDEGDELEIAKELEKAATREKLESAKETSGNSSASAGSGSSSSSGSGSLPHSFSVEEIQNVRKQLKSQQSLVEDGDNSSSGVSSDQDVPVGPPTGFDDTSRNNEPRQHFVVVLGDKESCNNKRMSYGSSSLLTRHAVSLAQLPPPIEADAEEQNNDLFVPPPPEFNADGSSASNSGELVFAPPPQFCDNRQQQQNRVKIVAAIPKVSGSQVKPPTGRLHSQ